MKQKLILSQNDWEFGQNESKPYKMKVYEDHKNLRFDQNKSNPEEKDLNMNHTMSQIWIKLNQIRIKMSSTRVKMS